MAGTTGTVAFFCSRQVVIWKSSAYRSDIFDACSKAVSDISPDLDFIRVDAEAFAACPDDSIDYAVMENTADAVVVPMDAGWNDIGSWSSLWDVGDKDENGNAVTGDVILHEARNSYIKADDKLVAAVGIDDLVVVSTKDALLVAHKERVRDAKRVANKLREDGRTEWGFIVKSTGRGVSTTRSILEIDTKSSA